MSSESVTSYQRLYASHPRRWREFQYVYPVLSRRSHGLSLGVNLNPDKVCNWDCVYCQVDRATPSARRDVDLHQVRGELDWMLNWASEGRVWEDESFRDVPEPLRRVNDIAFSGDGEPTTCSEFDQAVALAAELKAARGLHDVKVIVLTNMTMAHREYVRRGFALMDGCNGEIWAKLEAGTQAYYEQVDRSAVKLEKVLANILEAARLRPLVIQSLFMRLYGQPTPAEEFEAYLGRLEWLISQGGRIKYVQLYTVARQTAEAFVAPLSRAELDAMTSRFKQRLPGLAVEEYYGVEG